MLMLYGCLNLVVSGVNLWTVKAKFHYAIWFEPASNHSSEPASVMEFGFYGAIAQERLIILHCSSWHLSILYTVSGKSATIFLPLAFPNADPRINILSNCVKRQSLAWKFASLGFGSLRFLSTNIAQGNVATPLRYDRIFNYHPSTNYC